MNSLTYDDVKRDIKDYCVKNKISVSEFSRRAGIDPFMLLTFIRKGKGMLLPHLFAIAALLGYSDGKITEIYLTRHTLTGKTFGYWTVLRPVTLQKTAKDAKSIKYICRCICGKQKAVFASSLKQRTSLSCGCRRADNQTDNQVEGRLLGQRISKKLHDERLALTYGKQEANKNSKSGVRGVCPYGQDQWRATITAAGTQYELGIFDDLQKAIFARKQAEEELHGPLLKKAKKIKQDVLIKPPD